MKKYYVLDIFEYCGTYSYAFDKMDELVDFLLNYSKDNSDKFNYFIYMTYLNKEKLDKLNISILKDNPHNS